MANHKNLFRKASLTLVDGLLLVLGPREEVHGDISIGLSIRPFGKNEAKQKAKGELERKLKASEALSVEREPDGIKITNNTDRLARVQVAFIRRTKSSIHNCYPGQSATLPPSPSDEQMNLAPREARLFLFSETHENTGSNRVCGFDDYAVWGWDEKSVPLFLSEKAHLF